ncbi:hypothetical protein [Sphingomonas sp. R-74633]|uniref:hypothetical protein n=1 Tax=Sphingomonas sp. R-74633 TaxID=2751188 RepID=UPI0015D1D1C1|nr:hypothetical protein [Sphingomonas sp. R-74633]
MTTSFAPPKVVVDRRVEAGRLFTCDQLDVAGTKDPDSNKITPDIEGSVQLINNYIRAYRCAAHEAADGRQIFEVPSMLGLFVAGVGPALGLSPDAALAASAGAAIYGRGNSYYAPKEKAAVLDSALDAVLCVKAAAVGFDFFDTHGAAPSVDMARQEVQEANAAGLRADLTEQTEDVGKLRIAAEKARVAGLVAPPVDPGIKALLQAHQNTATPQAGVAALDAAADAKAKEVAATADTLRTVEIELAVLRSRFSAPRVHYEMVSTALLSIERVLAQRFSSIGSFDSAGIAAEFSQLGEKEKEGTEDKKDLETGKLNDDKGGVLTKSDPEYQQRKDKTELDLMQTKLQICVVRAKV